MRSTKTYILFADQKSLSRGILVDIITEIWEPENRWIVGEREPDGSVNYAHRTYATLADACASKGLTEPQVRRQTRQIERRRALAAATASATMAAV